MNSVRIALSPERIFSLLLIVVLCLTGLSSLGQFFKYGLGHDYVFGFVPLFYLNRESSVPTWFSSTMFLFAAALLAWIAVGKAEVRDRYAGHWKWLSAIFVLLGIDEIAGMHEMLSDPVRRLLDVGGMLYFAWVIPAGVALFALGLVYFRFWLSLPARVQWLFFLAGVTFVGAAAGLEMFEAHYVERFGRDNAWHATLCSAQEFFELLGLVVFVYGLLVYLRGWRAVVEIGTEASGQSQAADTPRARLESVLRTRIEGNQITAGTDSR